ncbi:response regulator receiver protein [Thiorhodococcus drewsii AZ1]|uniref:Response regulator receiver protein n=1 Tax=Thiorhodococcus drewsii AZ1 TaxID=765913 RepID=G2DYF4_9GAMM|nr:response regulator [Thiorhodococcus drewsii]EGV32581.1 response regulator receiver protein [Thiorhodococcus drewsii AZ1]
MPTNLSLTDLRVLLVDDDAFLRRVVSQVLSGLKLKQIAIAENGQEALTFLSNHEVDLLITDIQMPKMNGLELIKQIRLGNSPRRPDMPAIVVTSFSTMEVVAASLALDANGFLVKPITLGSAAKKISVAMQEKMVLRGLDHYRSVNTDLDSIAQIAADRTSIVEASILRGENDPHRRKPAGTQVQLSQLQPGMCLADDLYSKSGMKLMSAGQALNEGLINRIRELAEALDSDQIPIASSQS